MLVREKQTSNVLTCQSDVAVCRSLDRPSALELSYLIDSMQAATTGGITKIENGVNIPLFKSILLKNYIRQQVQETHQAPESVLASIQRSLGSVSVKESSLVNAYPNSHIQVYDNYAYTYLVKSRRFAEDALQVYKAVLHLTGDDMSDAPKSDLDQLGSSGEIEVKFAEIHPQNFDGRFKEFDIDPNQFVQDELARLREDYRNYNSSQRLSNAFPASVGINGLCVALRSRN